MRVIVTRNFDNRDPIGYLTLQDGVEIPPNSVFSLAYTVQEWTNKRSTKIQVQSVSLIPDSDFLQYLKHQQDNLNDTEGEGQNHTQ